MTDAQTGTPEQAGHAAFPTAGAKAAERLITGLAREIGRPAAVAWTHIGAVFAWLGTRPDPTVTGWRDTLYGITEIHPSLEGFADPAVVDVWDSAPGVERLEEIAALWREHPVDDHPTRPHGYLLGNAYQAVSEEARRGRALCQTPRFVADLLLNLGLTPALREYGPDARMIDPACGTGHLLVESQARSVLGLTDGRDVPLSPDRIHHALATVHGVDVDPYAVLIARLRLVMFANVLLRLCGAGYLPDDWPVNVVSADSLLDEDEPLLKRGHYHAVVMNPPYVTCKNPQQNDAIRARYAEVCSGRFSLALPFHQLAHELVVLGGWVAQLTANSFMKREFGKKYVETYLAGVDLRWIIDTSGAYLPGHGTPTVILVDRNQPPSSDTVATVQGIRGEPSTPVDPSQGFVWQAIERGVRAALHRHPDYR